MANTLNNNTFLTNKCIKLFQIVMLKWVGNILNDTLRKNVFQFESKTHNKSYVFITIMPPKPS